MEEITTWVIRISGYGSFDFEGTESEAEEMRVHKSKWERGVGIKYKKNPTTVIDKLTELKCWFFDRDGSCPSWVLTKIRQEKKLLNTQEQPCQSPS